MKIRTLKNLLGMTLLVALAALVSCVAASASTGQLRARASFDLNCPDTQLEIVPIDGRTKGVRGCGQQATYVESCEQHAGAYVGPGTGGSYRSSCTWMLNTDGRRTEASPAPAAPAPVAPAEDTPAEP